MFLRQTNRKWGKGFMRAPCTVREEIVKSAQRGGHPVIVNAEAALKNQGRAVDRFVSKSDRGAAWHSIDNPSQRSRERSAKTVCTFSPPKPRSAMPLHCAHLHLIDGGPGGEGLS